MGKALVVFDPAHGETRRVAEEIAVGLSRAGRVVTLVTRTQPAWVIAIHRFVEISMGISVGLLVTALWPESQAGAS